MCARETLVGFPLRVQSPARRRPVLRCKTVPTRKKTRRSVSFFVLSYRNTIDFRTPDLKITVRETTLQSSLWLFCIISRFKLQNPMILCQHLHLADGNGVEFCQPFRLRYSFIDEHSIQIFQI